MTFDIFSGLRSTAVAAITALTLVAAPLSATASTQVDVELQLLVDVSGSIDDTEFVLQRNGYANAFRNLNIQNSILDTDGGNRFGRSAVELIYWSRANQQSVAVGWTLLDDMDSINAFADSIEASSRPFSGGTAVGSAITFGAARFADNGYLGNSKVIDVSGDGRTNSGVDTATARDAAIAGGITRINGIPIGGRATVENFYLTEVIGGTNAFSLPAASFADFGAAVTQKIKFEITDTTPAIPVPASIPLLVSGLGMIAALRLRRKAA